jgi:uncharacterized protein YfbU (UPF0304 family)
MKIVNEVITILENGNWYSLEELNNYIINMPKSQIEAVLDFLFKYNFLEKNYCTGEFRLIPKMVALISLEK